MGASLKGIQGRLKALDKTASITEAMHNISISKVKTFSKTFLKYQSFKNKLESILHKAINQVESHPFIDKPKGEKKLFVVISGDRGLVGGYHNQLYKHFFETIKDLDPKSYSVFVVGKKGYAYFKKRKLPILNKQVISNHDDISVLTFLDQIRLVFQLFVDGKIDSLSLVYNHYVNATTQNVVVEQILPIKPKEKIEQNSITYYEVEPIEILEKMTLMYLETHIYGALIDAKLSEHSARLIAMKAATDNARNIHKKLTIEYHRVRQQSITSELIDIVNGTLS